MDSSIQVQILVKALGISLHANALREDINTYLIPLSPRIKSRKD